jgi:lysophospholipase L1-like esterase
LAGVLIESKRDRRRYVLPRVAIVVATALVAGLLGAPLAVAAQPLRYVALGDSSAAGPGIPNQVNAVCARSDRNWPRNLAAILGAELTDVTCSSARIPDLAGKQYGIVDPQFAALTDDTKLVTLAIGANDINLAQAFQECAIGILAPGDTCQEHFANAGGDEYARRIAATGTALGAALETIHSKSPQADVVVVGYLTYWQPGGCPPADPYAPADADYMQDTFDRLMTMLAAQAGAHDATYVDIRSPSAGHGLCAPAADRWLEGLVPSEPTVLAYHPNTAGMANAARIIAAEIA